MRTSFGTTQQRFDRRPGVDGEGTVPGPGAHGVARWGFGEKATWRRPAAHSSAGQCAFLSSSERFASGGPPGRASDAVLAYLVSGPLLIGQPTHAQSAMRHVARGVAAPPR